MKSVFTDEYNEFLQLMITARKQAGLTQQRLADLLQKPQSYVSKYERRERRIDIIEFLNISRTLGIDPCDTIRQIESIISDKQNKESEK